MDYSNILEEGDEKMEKVYTLSNPQIEIETTEGLHASLAVKLVQLANQYAIDFNLIYQDKVVDLKSILGLMSLAIPSGKKVIIEVFGPEDVALMALQQIKELIKK